MLEQKYAWSNSRIKLLRECMYKYYLTYYQSWNGWRQDSPEECRQAYMIKNMTNMYMFVGSIVHDVIEKIIKEGIETGIHPSVETAEDMVVQKLRRGWIESEQKRWQKNAKQYTNLAEHYYKEELTHDRLQYFKQKTISCMRGFYDTPLYKVIKQLKPEDWITIEEFQSFKLKDGEGVSVKIDTGFRHNGCVYLIDWKTGKVNHDVIEQLVVYAMYALKMGWAKRPEDIIIVPIYLSFTGDKNHALESSVSMKQINHQASIIKKEYPILEQAHTNKDDKAFFFDKRTDDSRSCDRCHFRDICPGANDEIEEGVTPF